MSRKKEFLSNSLIQQASGYNVKKGVFLILEKPVLDFNPLSKTGKIANKGRSDRHITSGLTVVGRRTDRPCMAGLTSERWRSDRHCVAGQTGFEQEAGGHDTLDSDAELIVKSDIRAQETEED